MVKLIICLAVIAVFGTVASAAECPSFNKVQNREPKCLHDNGCKKGEKCCPNVHNGRSCLQLNTLPKYDSESMKDKYSGGSGADCGGVKCSPYEKCETDQMGRKRCVRT